jgi:hypothetical protein
VGAAGDILFSSGNPPRLYRVSDQGGEPVPLPAPNDQTVSDITSPSGSRPWDHPRQLRIALTARPFCPDLTSFNVRRIKPHDNQRDVVAGVTLIGTSEQLLRGRLSRGLGLESSRNGFVGHHFG